MRFKEISIDNITSTNSYSAEQGRALRNISKKINMIGEFFDEIAKLENLVIKTFYSDYLNLIKIRENRTEIEKIGGAETYINNYFLPAVKSLEEKISSAIFEWDTNNQDATLEIIQSKIEVLKQIRKKIDKSCKEKDFIGGICSILDSFAHFKIYKMLCLESTLDRVESLLKFKDELISIVDSDNVVEEIKNKVVSIDDL